MSAVLTSLRETAWNLALRVETSIVLFLLFAACLISD